MSGCLLLNSIVVVIVTLISLSVLFQKRVRQSLTWRATVTPLASIIGSGFLVSAPLLILSTGSYAPIAMTVIVLIAYALGSSIRFNIIQLKQTRSLSTVNHIESVSRAILAVAYLISITFYLKLLATFLLAGVGVSQAYIDNILTTGLLLFIGLTGKARGLQSLESLEIYSVNIKISIIIALIVSHLVFNFTQVVNGEWVLKLYPHEDLSVAIQKLLGVLIIVQGFETSRYLQSAYSAELRVKTMKYAQILSGVIYIVFILSTLTAFNGIHALGKTTVIDVCRIIAPVLPFMLIVAAIMSQFSAAIADTIGSGGLIVESLSNRISLKNSYLVIVAIGVALTWLTDIYSIITLASKAFAIYYALQLILSSYLIVMEKDCHRFRLRLSLYIVLILLMGCVVIFGMPVKESGH